MTNSMSRILVLGGLNMDLVVRTPRFPSPGETINGRLFDTIPGGKGANQAVAMARLGGEVAMIGRVGADDFGVRLLATLSSEGVNTDSVIRGEDAATGVALITVDDEGENTIIVVPGANDQLAVEDVRQAFEAAGPISMLVMPLEVPLECIVYAAEMAKDKGARVILNAAPAQLLPRSLLRNVDFLVVNETEAALLVGDATASADVSVSALQAMGVRNVIVTLGAEGSLFAEDGKPQEYTPAFRVEAVDSTAAGDAFVGAFAVGLQSGLNMQDAVLRANAAGALAAAKLGAQTSLPTELELRTFLDRKDIGL